MPKKKIYNESREKLKYEIAEEMGLMDRVRANGWVSLKAHESGRLGGLISRREKEARDANGKEAEKG